MATATRSDGGKPAGTTITYKDSSGKVISTTTGSNSKETQDKAKAEYVAALNKSNSSSGIAKNAGFWNNVGVGEINASGFKNLDEWKSAYESGKAVAPPSAIGSSFKIDSASGRLVDVSTGAVKPNVKESASFYGIKKTVDRQQQLAGFSNSGAGTLYGGTSADKAFMKERGFEAVASVYDKDKGAGELYQPIRQASLSAAPEVVQAGALVAQQIAETPRRIDLTVPSEQVPYASFIPIKGGSKYVYVEKNAATSSLKEYTPEEVQNIYNKEMGQLGESARSSGAMTAVDFALLVGTFGRGSVLKNTFVKAGSEEALRLGFVQGGKQVVTQEAKQVAKQTAKTGAETLSEQFAKTFGRTVSKAKPLINSPIGRATTGLGIAATGNVIGQEAPEAFTGAATFGERVTGQLDLTDEQLEKVNKSAAKAYEAGYAKTGGYIQEGTDDKGNKTSTEVKGEASWIENVAINLVPVAKVYSGKYQEGFQPAFLKSLKEDVGLTDAEITRNKDALLRIQASRQWGATAGNIAVEIGGELGFRRLAGGVIKQPKLKGIKSGVGYGIKLGAASTPFGFMEGFSQDVIQSKSTYGERDAGRELMSGVWGAGVSGVFNLGTGVAMGAGGSKAKQLLPKDKQAFKKGASLGGKLVTSVGYVVDAPGEFIGDKSADIIENLTKQSRKVTARVPGRIKTVNVNQNLTVQKGKPSVKSSNFLSGLFGFGSSLPTSKGSGVDLGTRGTGKGEGQGEGKGSGKGTSSLDLGSEVTGKGEGKENQTTKQNTSVASQVNAENTLGVNVMTPVGGVGGFPFLPFGSSGQGTKRNRGSIKNELSEALQSMGVRGRQEASVGLDYAKKFNRLRR